MCAEHKIRNFAFVGFIVAWLLFGAWYLLNSFVHVDIRTGIALEAITVTLCPSMLALMAAGDRLLPQLTTMVVVSLVNAAFYWIIGNLLIFLRMMSKRIDPKKKPGAPMG